MDAKTAVDAIFVGKERACNRRFQQMCSHYLVDPPPLSLGPMARQWRPCTPASGWEKGQVENQVGTIRERLFAPRVRVRSMAELNDWLVDQCVARAKVQAHPEIGGKTIREVFEEERASLVPCRGRFDGFHAVQASVPKTCLVRFDNNRYSVQASAVGRPVEVSAYAGRIELRQDGRLSSDQWRTMARRRDRQRELALQEPRLTPAYHTHDGPDAPAPSQELRRVRPSSPEGSLFDADRGVPFQCWLTSQQSLCRNSPRLRPIALGVPCASLGATEINRYRSATLRVS